MDYSPQPQRPSSKRPRGDPHHPSTTFEFGRHHVHVGATTKSPSFDAKEISLEIHRSVTTKQRLTTLTYLLNLIQSRRVQRNASEAEQHQAILRSLVHSGSVNALCLQLGYVLHRKESTRQEIEMICTALNSFYTQCPDLATDESVETIASELIQLLLSAYSRGVIGPVISIWHVLTGSASGTALLLQHPDVLTQISETMQNHRSELLLECLGLLKNLSYYSQECRQQISEHSTMLETLSGIPSSETNTKVLERLSAVFRNLALSPNTRLYLAQQPTVLTALVQLSSHNSQTILRNVLNTFVSIAMDGDSCIRLVFHGEGLLIKVLTRLLNYNGDSMIRKRASRVVRLLCRDGSATFLISDAVLIETTAHLAIHDTNSDVRKEAADAFAACTEFFDPTMDRYGTMLDTLESFVASQRVSLDCIARALINQMEKPQNQQEVLKRRTLVDSFGTIASSEQSSNVSKQDICKIIMDLSSKDSTIHLVTSETIISALVLNLSDNTTVSNQNNEQRQGFAVKALLNLSGIEGNRKVMANHPNLLQAMIQYASKADNDHCKEEVKAMIIRLTTQL